MNLHKHERRLERLRLITPLATTALLSLMLSACNDEPVPSHIVVVRQHQTIDDIGAAECGDSILDLGVLPRRNLIRTFNNLPNNTVHLGQRLNIPNSFCAQTGDRVPSHKK